MDTNKRKTGLARLIEIAGTKRRLLIGAMLLAVITAIVQFVPIIAVYNILIELAEHALDPSLIDKAYIWLWSYIALGAFFAFGVLTFASLMLSHIAAFNILYEIRMQLVQKMVRLPLGFFSRRASGELKKIMSDDVERIELFIAHHIPDIVTALLFPLILVSYMFAVDWRLAIVVLAVLAMAFYVMGRMYTGKKIREVSKRYVETLGRMNASIVEYIRGIQVVKTFTESTNAYRKLNDDIKEYRKFANEVNVQYQPTYVGFLTILSSALLFIIPVAVWLLVGSASYATFVPVLLMFLFFGVAVFFPVLKLLWIGSFLNQNNMGVQKIDDILYMDEIEEPDIPRHPKDASVEFRNVSFAYDTTPILKAISFISHPGMITALVGPSGAGKSTVAMLAARFWDVQSGEILIGGVPVKEIPTSVLMDNVAFVFQDNMLFFDTIEENIRMGNKTATFEEVARAACAAQCHEFIESLPNGYQTLVGEGGIYLSGGEAQRIALARAILKDSPIILLDEATAFADPENEGKILAAFSHLIKGKTVLVIAHRLSTITNADRILYVDKGVIAEQGTHEQLLALKGEYARMWETYNRAKRWTIGGKNNRKL
ncbi:Xenobiotic-transporting ATPase [Odoribacter splanchnicus DSM 20712]|uniref:Xenobiotic-transporting ATPase n=1 Tax=Odoribacter splanchnicus (strain ATCC 29572 / DSM 20712 / CIP 104287 / JCM 15291 / NCTC 10825 / 1651/6) TaxID=709991 RepID=F9Z326_ODOSD|nr:ABC transporter ATP-binding protein [Odoribacter splanchnicus]ADY32410.1 Xenobiotic-transporting ATPase [Odoribacter splanchnicus DSM 20712]UEB86464.1 ABC transporter ATP-binding protein/permease [Odoribacter splanchnicus DSM 20712]SNV32482.1 putative transport-related membrane protein [Odoribacter splanchnicus]